MLSDIRAYLTERGRAPLSDIALHLGVSPDAARGMIQQWERRGKMRQISGSCGQSACGCASCPGTEAGEIYEWVG